MFIDVHTNTDKLWVEVGEDIDFMRFHEILVN